MTAYAAWGWVALEWWTWPLLFLTTMCGMLAGLGVQGWLDRRRQTDRGPVPCLAHMGRSDGMPVWCLKERGHDDQCWGVASSMFATMTRIDGR